MAYVGKFAADGSMNVTIVLGSVYTGLYAADGSINVVMSSGNSVYVGAYHPCGAWWVSLSPGTLVPLRASDGSLYINTTNSNTNSGQPVTVISGNLINSMGNAGLSLGAVATGIMTTTTTAPTGSVVIIGVSLNTNNAVTAASISDGTNSYTKIDSTGIINTVAEVTLWYAVLAAPLIAGSTITVTFSVPTTGAVNGFNISTLYATNLTAVPLDVFNHTSGVPGTSLSVATGVLTQANEMVFGFGGDTSGNPATVYNGASGFNNFNLSSSANGVTALDYKKVAATTSVTFGPSWSASLYTGAVVASFKSN